MAISTTSSTTSTSKTTRSAKGSSAQRHGYDLREWADKFNVSVDELRQLVASYMQARLGAGLPQMHN